MRKYNNNFKISLVLLLLVVIGIVYAYLTSNLDLAGSTLITGNTWDIHFANLSVSDGSVEAVTPATINSTDNTKINYSIELDQPGDYYEFSVDIVNSGSIPGKISLVTNTGIDSQYEDIIDYEVKYTNNKDVLVGDILNAGVTKRIRLKIYFIEDISNSNLPNSEINFDLEFEIEYNQSTQSEVTTDDIVQQLKTENSSCFTKYEGQVTDQVGVTKQASNVYFNKCADKRNIIFNNVCWQMIRTTETGGIKMVYNGEPVDGKCLNTRGDHKGIVGASGSTQTLNAEYLYGDSFTYDIINNTFTLTNTETATWSDSTYENLIGKFTCKSSSDTCTTIYQINGYITNTQGYSSAYTIGDTNYAQIGKSAFNANYLSPANVGYMFNKVYDCSSRMLTGTTEYKYGSGFTYDESTNKYTLSGTIQNISDWSTGYNQINNTHYTCWNTSGSCSKISYVYYTYSSSAFYFDITGGKDVNDALKEMLYDDNVNRYNSSIKGIIDAWYKQNMLSKTNMLEDTVYCNARNITNYGGWNPNGGTTTSNNYLQFKNYTSNNNLSCQNETDQFSVSNNKAKLTYPVGLINNEELLNIGTNSLRKTGVYYWGLSPSYFSDCISVVRDVGSAGGLSGTYNVNLSYGSRPAVTLSTGAVISSGDGSEALPWVIKEV